MSNRCLCACDESISRASFVIICLLQLRSERDRFSNPSVYVCLAVRCLSKCQSRKNANKLQRPGIRLCRSGNDTDVADLHVTSASVADEATVIRDVYEEPQTQAWGSRRDKKGRFLLTSKAISLALMGSYRGIVALLITGITYKKTLPIAVSRS